MKSNRNSYFRSIRRFLGLLPLLVFLLLTGAGVTVYAVQPVPLLPEGRATENNFGYAVAIDGDTALIGAASGIYIYVRNGTTWTQQAKLEASNGLGLSAKDLDGDTAVAAGAASTAPDAPPALYVFVRSGTTWTQQAILTVDHDYINYFPTRVRLDGDLILAGAEVNSGNPEKSGFVAYGFARTGTTWSGETEFGLSGTQGNDIALNGDTAVLYNHRDDGDYEPDGWIYIYRYISGEWLQEAPLSPDYADPGIPGWVGNFYDKIDISGNTLVSMGTVTAYVDDYRVSYRVIFVFTSVDGVWTRQAIISPLNNQGHHFHPESIALDGDTLILDAPDPDSGIWSQLVYIRTGSTWALQATITGSQSYYRSIDLSGNTLLLGVPVPDDAVYVQVRNGTTWSQQAKLTLDGAPDELLANGGFESPISGTSPVGNWKLAGDGVGQDNLSHSGNASLRFTTGTARAIQNVDLTRFNLKAGDKIRLTGFYNKLSTGSYKADMWLYVSYTNLPEDQMHITVQKPTSGWQSLPRISTILKAKPTRVRVVLKASADDQQYIYFDDLSLKLVTPALKASLKAQQASELLPLP